MRETSRIVKETASPKSEAEIAQLSSGASAAGAAVAAIESVNTRIGRYRWLICALLFFATTINYIDRQVLGILAADESFKHAIGWNEAQYGYVNTAFQAAYALGLLIIGSLMDRFGTRKGFSFAVGFWSVAAMCHALARSAFGFGVTRFSLGLGEAGPGFAPFPPPSPSSFGGVRELLRSPNRLGAGVFGISRRVMRPWPTVQRFVVTQ